MNNNIKIDILEERLSNIEFHLNEYIMARALPKQEIPGKTLPNLTDEIQDLINQKRIISQEISRLKNN